MRDRRLSVERKLDNMPVKRKTSSSIVTRYEEPSNMYYLPSELKVQHRMGQLMLMRQKRKKDKLKREIFQKGFIRFSDLPPSVQKQKRVRYLNFKRLADKRREKRIKRGSEGYIVPSPDFTPPSSACPPSSTMSPPYLKIAQRSFSTPQEHFAPLTPKRRPIREGQEKNTADRKVRRATSSPSTVSTLKRHMEIQKGLAPGMGQTPISWGTLTVMSSSQSPCLNHIPPYIQEPTTSLPTSGSMSSQQSPSQTHLGCGIPETHSASATVTSPVSPTRAYEHTHPASIEETDTLTPNIVSPPTPHGQSEDFYPPSFEETPASLLYTSPSTTQREAHEMLGHAKATRLTDNELQTTVTELSRLLEELRKLQKKEQNLSKEISNLKEKNDILREEVGKLCEEKGDIETEISNLLTLKKRLDRKAEKLSEERENRLKEISDLKVHRSVLFEEIQELHEEKGFVLKEVCDLRDRLEEERELHDRLERMNKKAQERENYIHRMHSHFQHMDEVLRNGPTEEEAKILDSD